MQIIKKDPTHGGILQFGTELVGAADGSIVAMLGASPGASTAVWIMVQVIERCFPRKIKERRMVCEIEGNDSFLRSITYRESALCQQVRAETAAVLQINTQQ